MARGLHRDPGRAPRGDLIEVGSCRLGGVQVVLGQSLDARMPRSSLDSSDVHPGLEEQGSEGPAEQVGAELNILSHQLLGLRLRVSGTSIWPYA